MSRYVPEHKMACNWCFGRETPKHGNTRSMANLICISVRQECELFNRIK